MRNGGTALPAQIEERARKGEVEKKERARDKRKVGVWLYFCVAGPHWNEDMICHGR